jgi:oligopeptide/dipeptide ABC transporter ATP-binding protein
VTDAETVLDVADLHVHFDGHRTDGHRTTIRAVDGVSFTIRRGEILALVGESGCGKTTIAQAVMRLVPLTSGRIISGGRDLAKLGGRELRKVRRGFQMIFQDPFASLDPRRTAYQIIAEPLVIHGVGSTDQERRELVLQALDFAYLRPAERLADRYPHELSGGQRQRVAIAAAMVLNPALVVADEPVSMLDVSAQTGILKLMVDLRDRLDVSYLFITHDLSIAWVVADRIAVVYLGRIVEIGPSVDVVSNPSHPYTRALLAAATDTDPNDETATPQLTGETPSAANVPAGCRFHPRCPRYRALGEPERCRSEDPLLLLVPAPATDAGPHESACHFASEQP